MICTPLLGAKYAERPLGLVSPLAMDPIKTKQVTSSKSKAALEGSPKMYLCSCYDLSLSLTFILPLAQK